MQQFDHHCIWLGTCIGKNNYPLFIAFVGSLNALILSVGATCVAQLVKQADLHGNDEDGETTTASALGNMRIATWFLLVYCIMMQLFCGFLLSFHCKLINENTTTNEYLKHRSKSRNYQMRAETWFSRLKLSLCFKKQPSLVSNDLIRYSLLLESFIDAESSFNQNISSAQDAQQQKSMSLLSPASRFGADMAMDSVIRARREI